MNKHEDPSWTCIKTMKHLHYTCVHILGKDLLEDLVVAAAKMTV